MLQKILQTRQPPKWKKFSKGMYCGAYVAHVLYYGMTGSKAVDEQSSAWKRITAHDLNKDAWRSYVKMKELQRLKISDDEKLLIERCATMGPGTLVYFTFPHSRYAKEASKFTEGLPVTHVAIYLGKGKSGKRLLIHDILAQHHGKTYDQTITDFDFVKKKGMKLHAVGTMG